jgi:hypothetical protein
MTDPIRAALRILWAYCAYRIVMLFPSSSYPKKTVVGKIYWALLPWAGVWAYRKEGSQ